MELGISQRELAELLGYKSRSAIANIEAGKSELPASRLLDVARTLDTSAESLLTDLVPVGISTADLHADEGTRNAVIVLAGGRSTRSLRSTPNQFVAVLGRPVISWCLDVYQRHPMIDDIVVACLDGWEDVISAYARQSGVSKLRAIVPAGETGVESIRCGIVRLESMGYHGRDTIVVQESTRPLVTAEMVSRVLLACASSGAVATCAPMADSVQFVRDGAGGWTYVDRDSSVDLQSPDALAFDVLHSTLAEAEALGSPMRENSITMMLHTLGRHLNFVECNTPNMKIVHQDDLAVFEALARRRGL